MITSGIHTSGGLGASLDKLKGLDGWCRVFHQSTEYLITMTLIQPTMESTAHALAAASASSNAERSEMTPIKRKNCSSIEVSRPSQIHQVPQMSLPQIDPDASASAVNQAPRGAAVLATISASFIRHTNVIVPAKAINGKKAKEILANGT